MFFLSYISCEDIIQFIDIKSQYLRIDSQVNTAMQRVFDHGQFIMGPEVSSLESKLCEYTEVEYCVSCSSGTDALLMSLLAIDVKPGDAIITTPFTFIATAEVIRLVGATPVFVDIEQETFNINPNLIPEAIESAEQKGLVPKAIIPVDLFGQPADYKEIESYTHKYDLFTLEDAAQGFGGEINGQKAGSFGNVAATSFFPAKPLGCYGDGGAILTANEELAQKMKSIRVHGGGIDKYDNVRLGINGRLDTLQAAILLEKFSIFTDEVATRNEISHYYTSHLPKYLTSPFLA